MPRHKSIISFNPATHEKIWEVPPTTFLQIDEWIISMKQIQDSWAKLSIDARIQPIKQYQQLLEHHASHLSQTISQETGKPLWESQSEVQAMIRKIDITIDAYQNRCHPQHQSNTHIRYKPHGIVVVIGPFNFPGHIPNGHIIPALISGNAVLFKPSELTPLAGQQLIKLWEETTLPVGLIRVIFGEKKTGQHLVSHPQVNGIYFTGSSDVGIAINQAIATTPGKIAALEMGGNNPLIVGHITNIQAAAYLIIQSAYITSGQRCSCARRLILLNTPIHHQLIDCLVEMISHLKVGAYTSSPEPFMGPVISKTMSQKLMQFQDWLLSQGSESLVHSTPILKNPTMLTPGLLNVTSVDHIPDQEYFGPLLQVYFANTIEQAIAIANQTRFGLSASLLSDQMDEYHQFYNMINAGIINWNAPTTGANSFAPFGGIGDSGNHRPSAYYAVDYCNYPVASTEHAKLSIPKTLLPGL